MEGGRWTTLKHPQPLILGGAALAGKKKRGLSTSTPNTIPATSSKALALRRLRRISSGHRLTTISIPPPSLRLHPCKPPTSPTDWPRRVITLTLTQSRSLRGAANGRHSHCGQSKPAICFTRWSLFISLSSLPGERLLRPPPVPLECSPLPSPEQTLTSDPRLA